MTFEHTGIYHSQNVADGAACILGTEIPVWVLVSMRRHGTTAEAFMRIFNNITKTDIDNAFAYAACNAEEMSKYMGYAKVKNREPAGWGCFTPIAGAVIAACLSWSVNKSIVWAILHGLCTWFYVIYFVILKSFDMI